MAEHDWYEKHKKDVVVALKKGKGADKDNGVPCTLVKMKDGSAFLCTSVSNSKAAVMVKEARAAGGKVLSKGALYHGDDGPTFAVSDGSTSVKVLFAAAAADVGVPLRVTILAVAPEAENGTASPAPVSPAPPQVPAAAPAPPQHAEVDKARFTTLLRDVRSRFQHAVAADPPNKAVLVKAMSVIVTAAKEHDFGRGLKALQALNGALQRTPAAVPPPAASPPPTPSAAAPAAAAAAAAIRAALAKMIPLVKNGAAANPDRKKDLFEPLKRCQDHLKNDNAAEARAALFDLNRVLKELNGAIPPSPPSPADQSPTAEDAGETREEEVEQEGQTATTTADDQEHEEEEPTTTVGVWVKARDKAIVQVQALQAALGKETQETGDPDYDLIADKGLAAITKRLQVGLHVALLEFDGASGDARAAARAKAQKVVNEFQAFLGSNGLIDLAEDNPWGVKVEIRSTLGAALEQLSKTLRA